MECGLQELEETLYWMELIVESGIFSEDKMKELMQEANELTAILTTCVKNAKKKRDEEKQKKMKKVKDEKRGVT